MSERKIVYDDKFGLSTFKRMIIEELGEKFWNELIEGMTLPDIDSESQCQCMNMYNFVRKLKTLIDDETIKKIFSKVRHGLTPSQVVGAREEFLAIGDLDKFIQKKYEEDFSYFIELNSQKKDFYGDMITDDVLEFLRDNRLMIGGVRKGNKILVRAFPANMSKYLQADNEKMKRYYACHCPFAKESILANHVVSDTLCYCSLGHVKNYWEAVFEQNLDGEVLETVLSGNLQCCYSITIPEDIMELYVKEEKGE